MTPLANLGPLLQVFVAFLLFVAAYLGLLLIVVILLVIADVVYEGIALLRARRPTAIPAFVRRPIRKRARWSERLHHMVQH